jgi:UDP-glucose 4-epimerase
MGELYAKHFNDIEKIPTIIVRPFNAYGPREHFDGVYGEVIPRFAIQALNGKQPTIFGDGTQTRDFTYVTDTAEGIYKAAQCENLYGDVINIAYGKEVSINSIAQAITKLAGIPYHPTILPSRPNDVDRLAANTKKAKKLLDFTSLVAIDEGLSRYISWMKTTYPNPSRLLSKIPLTNW